MTKTTAPISELSLVFSNLKAWLRTPPRGTAPPQGITKQIIFKGLLGQFETFNAIAGAPGLFPLQWLFSGVITADRGSDALTGTGALFDLEQRFSDVNWLDLNDPSALNLSRGNVTLEFIPGNGSENAAIRLQMADLNVTFDSGSGNRLSATLIGYARDNSGSNAVMNVSCLEAPATL